MYTVWFCFVFLVAGLVDLSWESLNFSNAQNTEKGMYLYPKMASRLEKSILRAQSKTGNFGLFALYSCYFFFFFISYLAAPWLTYGYYWRTSLTHIMLITAFGLSVFGPKVTRRGWVSTPNWVPSGLWLQWHNPLSN